MSALMNLKCFASLLKSQDVLLRADNTTAIAYINKKSGVQYPELKNLAKMNKEIFGHLRYTKTVQ